MDVTTAYLLHQYRVQISDLEAENKRLRGAIRDTADNLEYSEGRHEWAASLRALLKEDE